MSFCLCWHSWKLKLCVNMHEAKCILQIVRQLQLFCLLLQSIANICFQIEIAILFFWWGWDYFCFDCLFVCLFWSFICQVARPGDSEVTFSVFESSYHLLLPVFKGRSNPVKCHAQGNNKRTCRPISTLTF